MHLLGTIYAHHLHRCKGSIIANPMQNSVAIIVERESERIVLLRPLKPISIVNSYIPAQWSMPNG